MASLTTLPQETLQQITNLLCRRNLLNLCISHRNLYNHNISKIYHTVHFLDHNVEVNPLQKKPLLEHHSTAIHDLSKFARTIESSESLRSLVSNAIFQWGMKIDAVTKPDMSRILELLGPSLKTLHYAPAEWDFDVSKELPLTSIDTPYLAHTSTARQDVFSLFSVPTLRHVTLHHYKDHFYIYRRSPHGAPPSGFPNFNLPPPPDDPDTHRAGTSNVEYLSIRETESTRTRDLAEIMTWPKALKTFDCTLGLREEYLEYLTDPSQLIGVLEPQRDSLEQVSLDFHNRSITYGTLGTTLRQFPNLKRLSIPRNFLAKNIQTDTYGYTSGFEDETDHMYYGQTELYVALPPALEELILNVDADMWPHEEDEFPNPGFLVMVREIATHKQELYPSLRRVVFWKECQPAEFTPEEIDSQEKEMIRILGFSRDFEDVGVEFVFKVSDMALDFQDPYLCFGKQ